jgi:hypothetical protein
MKHIQKQFSTAAKPKCSCGSKNFLPAEDFEAHTGLSGISAHYVFPQHNGAGNIFKKIMSKASDDPAAIEQMRKDWNEIVTLNPVLEKVSVNKNNRRELCDALFGAISQFNTDDINIFITTTRKAGIAPARDVPKIYGLEELNRNIELTAGFPMPWVTAPETVQKIKTALEARTGKPIDWIMSPENEKKIRDFMVKELSKPTDTPKETAHIKAICEGPFGTAFEYGTLYDQYIRSKDMQKIRDMIFNGTVKKQAPKPHP